MRHVEAAMAWLRASKPGAVGGNAMYHAPTLARAASVLLILAALHDRGMRDAAVADVAMYSALSTSATRARLHCLVDVYGVVTCRRVGRRVWYRADAEALVAVLAVEHPPGGDVA